MKTKIVLSVLLFSLCGCYSKQRFARVALESSQPILADYREYLAKDKTIAPESKEIRLDTVKNFEEFLKEGAKK